MVIPLKNLIFPFSAIIGQKNAKKALILNAINPSIGGVLIKGYKGTGKTTAVRALADLLPPIKTVKGCSFNCDPDKPDSLCGECRSGKIQVVENDMRVVELPLGSTEDRVVGSINIEKALKEGSKTLEPGLLAEANRNILYIDEINLLDDNLVDVLLDAAAYGVNIVEREGVSITHPSHFILVGTMNPAEGELRQQLSDRIGLHVFAKNIIDVDDRIKIMKRREEFENNPSEFIEKFKDAQKEIRDRIIQARQILKDVTISQRLMRVIARLCINMGVDGHRADIAILKTSKTIAAYHNRRTVTENDVLEAAELVLGERFENQEEMEGEVEKAAAETAKEADEELDKENQPPDPEDTGNEVDEDCEAQEEDGGVEGVPHEIYWEEGDEYNQTPTTGDALEVGTPYEGGKPVEATEEVVDIQKFLKVENEKKQRIYGKRVASKTIKGRYIKSKLPKEVSNDIAIDATLRAAALGSKGNIKVEMEDIRHKMRKHDAKASIALIVDISGSMFFEGKVNRIKGILYRIMENINRHQDKISVIGFKGDEAEIIIPTTRRAFSFKDQLDNLTVGGTTPLASGLKKGFDILLKEKLQDEYIPLMIIFTDGMPNVGFNKKFSSLSNKYLHDLGFPIELDNSPVEDAIRIAENLKDKEINTLVVNFGKEELGHEFNMDLSKASGGRYYDLQDLINPETVVTKILDYERSQL